LAKLQVEINEEKSRNVDLVPRGEKLRPFRGFSTSDAFAFPFVRGGVRK